MDRFKEAVTALGAAMDAEKKASDDGEAERLHRLSLEAEIAVLESLPETADDIADALQIVRELCVDGDVPASEQLPRHLIEASIAALRTL